MYIILSYYVNIYCYHILYSILFSRGKYAEITLDTCARCGSGTHIYTIYTKNICL